MDDWVTTKAGLWTGLWTEIWTQNKCGTRESNRIKYQKYNIQKKATTRSNTELHVEVFPVS